MVKEDRELDEFESEIMSLKNFQIKEFKRGGIYKVKIVKVDDDFLLVDVGRKSEAFIPKEEIICDPASSLKNQFKAGNDIVVKAMRGGGPTEGVVLSNKRAANQILFDKLEEGFKTLQTIDVTVKEKIKGGLSVEIDNGVKAFLPATLVSAKKESNLDKFVGQTLPVKIIEFDRRKKRIVVSRRIIEEEEILEKREDLISSIQIGSVLEGTVTRIVDYGAFIDIGYGVEGLIHISELSWREGINPSEILKVGQKLNVRVIGMSDEKDRISLSYKRTLPDPWENIDGKYKVGDIISGKVVKDIGFGAIVELDEGINGFIHISQLSNKKLNSISESVSVGDVIDFEIIEVDIQQKKIKLSRKNLLPKEKEETINEETNNKFKENDYSAYVDVFVPKNTQ
jgi:4-hydroxy-3-methylbut-2-enyl diphosphate reductase